MGVLQLIIVIPRAPRLLVAGVPWQRYGGPDRLAQLSGTALLSETRQLRNAY